MASSEQTSALHERYAAWASARDLSMFRHDACFRGKLHDVEVVIESSIRDSGFYDVVLEVAIESGEAPQILRRGQPPAGEGAHAALHAVLERHDAITSLRLEARAVAVRLAPATPPATVETVTAEVIEAVRQSRGAGPYR